MLSLTEQTNHFVVAHTRLYHVLAYTHSLELHSFDNLIETFFVFQNVVRVQGVQNLIVGCITRYYDLHILVVLGVGTENHRVSGYSDEDCQNNNYAEDDENNFLFHNVSFLIC